MDLIVESSRKQSRIAKWGWVILIGMSVLLMLAGILWYATLPEMALDNIAERTSLKPADFMEGKPSASDVITLNARGEATGYAALGLLALIVAREGFRKGTRWAWMAMWVLVGAFAVIALNFTLAAGGLYGPGIGFIALAVFTLVGLLLSSRGLEA